MPRRRNCNAPTINELAVLGYGYHLSFTDTPDLTSVAMREAVTTSPYEIGKKLNPVTIQRACANLCLWGVMEHQGWTNPPTRDVVRPRHRFRVTEDAAELLTSELVIEILQNGLTLSETLLIPVSIDSVLEHTNLEARIRQSYLGSYILPAHQL